jgi:hypothetical protein
MKKAILILLAAIGLISIIVFVSNAQTSADSKTNITPSPAATIAQGGAGSSEAGGAEVSATVEGYLADVTLGKAGTTDTTVNPESTQDLKSPAASNAGYGMFVYDADQKTYKFYMFDQDSNVIVKRDILDKADASSVEPIYVQAQGRINPSQGLIKVESISQVNRGADLEQNDSPLNIF